MRGLLLSMAVIVWGGVQLCGLGGGGKCFAADGPLFTFVDEQGTSRGISAGEFAKLPRKSAKVTGSDKQPAEYEGVAVPDLLEHLGVVLGKELRGARVPNYVLLEASDGYRVVLALAEVDPATTDKLVLLADRKDGKPLPEKEGPLRLVIPDEKRPMRWIRMIQKIGVRSPAAG